MSDVSATLAERGGRYGAFADHAKIAQGIIEVLHSAPNWSKLDPDMKQALHVIGDKIARILNGDPYYDDNWHDIQGYARLVEARIHEMQKKKQPEVNITAPDFGQEAIAKIREAMSKEMARVNEVKEPYEPGYYGDQEDKFLNNGGLQAIKNNPGYYVDAEGKLFGPGEDKANSSHYDVGNYRG